MKQFKGFKTKEEAKKFQKKNGGMICTKYKKDGTKHPSYNDYMCAVMLGGLDDKEYPYCVQWNI